MVRGNVDILAVSIEDHVQALDEAERHQVGSNDALAYAIMKRINLMNYARSTEILSVLRTL